MFSIEPEGIGFWLICSHGENIEFGMNKETLVVLEDYLQTEMESGRMGKCLCGKGNPIWGT